MFVGRQEELLKLEQIRNKLSSSLIVIMGRRRIGKSTLIKLYAKNFKNFYEFSGLAPTPNQTNQDQLNEFYLHFKRFSKKTKFHQGSNENEGVFTDWSNAFYDLGQFTRHGENLIFLDEISWMGNHDTNFSGKLKIAWDQWISQNPKNILVVCGSVSSWIEDNILLNSDFVGRISSEIHLQELSLNECTHFWGKHKDRISSFEKLKLLSITGGIPKYLEEMNAQLSAEENIFHLCFQKEGFLFREFDRIFSDLFMKRTPMYKKIIETLSTGSMSADDLAKKIKTSNNGDLVKMIHHLELAGFVKRYHTFSLRTGNSRFSKIQLTDNYIRFYLKYIMPQQKRILQLPIKLSHLEQLNQWPSTFGLLFESLIVKNLESIVKLVKIDSSDVVWAGPFFQTKTKKKGACQIDLMIVSRFGTVYVCEVKTGENLTSKLLVEVQKKIETIDAPKRTSFRPILIVDEIPSVSLKAKCESYFDKVIYFEQLLKM